MKRCCRVIVLSMLLASCAASEDSKSKAPTPVSPESISATPTVDAAPAVATPTTLLPSIASVLLNQDCPDPKTEFAASPAAGARSRRSDSAGSFAQPCSQSSVQLAFTGQGARSATVQLRELRLLSAEGKRLGLLNARLPTIWRDGVYVAWDGVVPAEADQKVSYKLSLPDWAAVEKETGASSFGQMYLLEIDVDVDGTITTLRSPQFERERVEVIRT